MNDFDNNDASSRNNPPDNAGLSKMAVWIPIGLSFGVALGLVMDNLALGMAMGMAFGTSIGAAMALSRNKNETGVPGKQTRVLALLAGIGLTVLLVLLTVLFLFRTP